MSDSTQKQEPSELVKASPLLMSYLRAGVSLQEVERRAQGAQRLKEASSSNPFYAARAKKYPDYWNELYSSAINS